MDPLASCPLRSPYTPKSIRSTARRWATLCDLIQAVLKLLQDRLETLMGPDRHPTSHCVNCGISRVNTIFSLMAPNESERSDPKSNPRMGCDGRKEPNALLLRWPAVALGSAV